MSESVRYHYGKFPPESIDWAELIDLLGPANASLARYDGVLSTIPNANILLSPLTAQEAVLSSRIEGTQATLGEVLEYEARKTPKEYSPEKRDDINEVLNYREAMWHALALMDELPLCQRVVKEAHRVLLDGVRGQNKSPGEYRRISNWIGPPGVPMEEAHFVPISAEDLPNGMSRWEAYIHAPGKDQLVKLAIIHAEFEALHPFLDGNGRLGRMLIPLFLLEHKLIRSPSFYISAYFEKNRSEYYQRLKAISKDNDWTGWCRFFLKAVIEQSRANRSKAEAILNLYNDKKSQLVDLTHSQYAIHALDYLFTNLIFNASDFTCCRDIPTPTAKRLLVAFRENGILKVVREARGRRPAVYVFAELFNIAEGKEVF